MTTARTQKKRRAAATSPFAAAMDQLMRDYADLAVSWTEEQRIAAALWVIPKLMTHAREGGSFRTLSTRGWGCPRRPMSRCALGVDWKPATSFAR